MPFITFTIAAQNGHPGYPITILYPFCSKSIGLRHFKILYVSLGLFICEWKPTSGGFSSKVSTIYQQITFILINSIIQ